MSTNGRFEDPVDDQQRNQQQPSSPNFFPERWNGVGDRQTAQPAPSTEQRLYDSAYRDVPQDTRQQQQYRDVPQEFGRQPCFSQTDGQGNVYNFYIREANINMGNQTPGYDYRQDPRYDYRQYDPNCQNQNRRINYYDDPREQQYEQQARMAQLREQQYERAMWQQQQMRDRYYGGNGYDQPQNYNQDYVHGGRDGYTSSRTRYNSGYDSGIYNDDCFGTGGGRDDFGRVVDLGFGILDRVFANQAARRGYSNNNNDNRYYPTQQPRYQAPNYYGNGNNYGNHGDCHGNNGGGNYRSANNYNNYNNSGYQRGSQRSPQSAMPPGYADVVRRRGH